jgi:hypothetical protein
VITAPILKINAPLGIVLNSTIVTTLLSSLLMIAASTTVNHALASDSPSTVQITPDIILNAMARMLNAMGVSDAPLAHDETAHHAEPMWPTPLFSPIPEANQFHNWLTTPLATMTEQMHQATQAAASSMPSDTRALQTAPQTTAWTLTTLEGIWESRDGGLLIVHGARFRLYQPCAGSIDGLIQQRNQRIALYNPENDYIRPYDYAQFEGRLVLRDPEGTLFLYRRLWQDQPVHESKINH